jgi:hypothetical protein
VCEGGVRDRLQPANVFGRGSFRPHSHFLPQPGESYAWPCRE